MACESVCKLSVLMNDWVVDGPLELEAEHGLSYAMLLTGFSLRYDFETIPEKFVRGEGKVPDYSLRPCGHEPGHRELPGTIRDLW